MKQAIPHKTTETKVPERTLFDTIGDELQRARVAKNLSIEEVADILNIRAKFIESLEKNETADFPAAVYGVAFLRSYASFLGLKSDELVKQYQSQNKTVPHLQGEFPIKSESSVVPDKSVLLWAGVLLIAFIGGVYALMHFNDAVTKNEEQKAAATLETVTQSESLVGEATLEAEEEVLPEGPSEEKTHQQEATEPMPAGQGEPNAEQAQADEAYSEIKGTRYGDESGARIVLFAKEDSWIDVSGNGKSVFNRVLKAGDAYFVPQADKPFRLHTGNAKGIVVYVDKVEQGTLSKTEKKKKNIVLDAEAIRKK